MNQKSNNLAVGGLFTALSVIIMLFGGMLGIGTFAAPMLAGFCTLFVLLSSDIKTAVLQWLSAGLLVLILSTDKELAVLFLTVFGWYPIIRCKMDSVKSLVVRLAVKLTVFNASVIITYLLLWAFLYGFDWNASGYENGLFVFFYLLVGNLIFLLYDKCLSMFERKYNYRKKNHH